MDHFYWLLLLVAGYGIWWKMKKEREPAVVGELIRSLRNFADGKPDAAKRKYNTMADTLREAEGFAARGEKLSQEDYERFHLAFCEMTDDGFLLTLGFSQASGRGSQGRNAIYSLWKKVSPN